MLSGPVVKVKPWFRHSLRAHHVLFVPNPPIKARLGWTGPILAFRCLSDKKAADGHRLRYVSMPKSMGH